jgi:cytochrome c oxidase subunit 4
MSSQAESHKPLFIKIWIGLLVLTLIEVLLAYIQFDEIVMLTMLMGLSIVKAVMIMAYFMHLKFDLPVLGWTVSFPLVACILIMMGYFFPDSFRILDIGFDGWK